MIRYTVEIVGKIIEIIGKTVEVIR